MELEPPVARLATLAGAKAKQESWPGSRGPFPYPPRYLTLLLFSGALALKLVFSLIVATILSTFTWSFW